MTHELQHGAAQRYRRAYRARAAYVAGALIRTRETCRRGRPYRNERRPRMHGLPECSLGWVGWGLPCEISQPVDLAYRAASGGARQLQTPSKEQQAGAKHTPVDHTNSTAPICKGQGPTPHRCILIDVTPSSPALDVESGHLAALGAAPVGALCAAAAAAGPQQSL